MALTDLTRISTSGIATGTSLSGAILHGDAHFRGTQVGVTSALFDSSDNALEFNDNVKVKLGNGGDLELYHTGARSEIINNTGDLIIQPGINSNLFLRSQTGAPHFKGAHAAQVEIYYNGNEKIRTTNEGAVVTGILTATGFSGPTNNTSGIATFYDLRVSNNLTVEGTTSTLDTTLIGVDRVEVGANSNTVVGVAVTQSGTADIVRLFDGASQVVTVDDEGRVGIGSATPAAKLDVSPTIQIKNTALNGAANLDINAANGGQCRINLYAGVSGGVNRATRIDFHNQGVAQWMLINDFAQNGTNDFSIRHGSEHAISCQPDGTVSLYDDGSESLRTDAAGILVPEKVIHLGDTDTFMKFDTNTISFETGGYERFRITSDGRFGFNTTNPDSTFRMDLAGSLRVGTGSYGSRLQFSRSGLGDELVIGVDGYGNSTTNEATIQSSINSPRPLVFATNNTERLRIKSDGHIEQTVGADNVGFDQVAAGNHYITNVINANRSGANDHLFIQQGQWNGKDVAAIKLRAGADTSNKDDGYITFETSSANNQTERLRIESNGNVKVTTGTQYKGFNVSNSSNLVAELVGLDSDNDNGAVALWDGGVKKTFLVATGYSYFMGGNVGINTTTPTQKLVSYADSGYPFVANGPSNSIALNNAGVIVFGTKDVAQYASGSFDATDYTFKSSGTVKFTMSSAGQFVLASGGIDFNTAGTGTFYNPGLSDATGFNFLSNQIIAYTANTPRLYINSNGAIGIGTASPQTNAKLQVQGNVGSSGYFYTTTTSSPQTDFTSSIASNKAGLLLHRSSEINGDYGGLEFHNHPSSITTYRKGGIYYQTNGTGFGRGDIVFANDNAGDSGLVSPTDHKFRIKNDGSLRAFTASNAVSCFSNYDHGNVDFNHRGGRTLTSNAYGWDGNASSDGSDPILVLAVENRAGNSDIGDAYGLALHSESQDDDDYGPIIGWTNRSNSGSYNTTYAAIAGKKTGQATDANWSCGELHFYTNKPAGYYADPTGTFPSHNYAGYMNQNPDLKITSKGYVVTHRNPAFAAHGAGSWTNITNGKFDFNGLGNNYGGDFGIRNDNYDTSNARFTAPVTGIYHFSVNIYTNSTTLTEIKSIVPRINGSEVHNGNDTVFFCGIRQNSNALADGNTISGSLTLRLVKDDYIEVWARANITQQWAYYKGHSSWTGHLVG